jgi:hypothetical protein
MQIVLASYFEPDNHGAGRKIGISPGKPKNLPDEHGYDCDLVYAALAPNDNDYWDYHKQKKQDPETASKTFVSSYRAKLRQLVEQLRKTAEEEGKTVEEVIGLQDGDTLLSWELGGHTTYREITAEYLRELGYDVEER